MQTQRLQQLARSVFTAGLVLTATMRVWAQSPDNMQVVVNSNDGTAGASVGCFAYDPVTDTMYVASFGSGGSLRRVNQVGGTPSGTLMVSSSEWQLFHLDGNPTWGSGTPTPSGMVMNKLPILDADGTTVLYPAYSKAWIVDAVTTVTQQPGGILRNDMVHRVYLYNLQQVQLRPTPLPPPPPYYDGRDVFTSLVSRLDMQQAIGTTATSDNFGRQPAWSSDGQSLYCMSSASAFGGIWKVNARTGAVARIYADELNNEPGVIHTSTHDFDPANSVQGDQIVICGTSASGNAGAVDYVIDDGSNVHGPYPLFRADRFLRFVEWNGYDYGRAATAQGTDPIVNSPSTLGTVFSVEVDADANVYFYNTSQQWVWRYDTEGRFAGLKSKQLQVRWNKANGNGGGAGSSLRLSLRTVTHGQAPNQFEVPQLLFQSVDLKAVGGLTAFKPGDFNRDNVVDQADLALFRAALHTPVGTFDRIVSSVKRFYEAPTDGSGAELELVNPTAYVNYLKYDLNCNNLVTGKDALILWRFLGYAPVDYDTDGDVDSADFGHFQTCWTGPGGLQRDPLCADADLDNDEDVDLEDLDLFMGCANGPAVPADVKCLDRD